MHNRLQKILAEKAQELARLKCPRKSLKAALRQTQLSVIAEIKRASPSKGELAEISDPCALAERYVAGGAAAISVLTDQPFFGGCLEDLENVSKALRYHPQPILRKDFLIDPLQIAEAFFKGADAVLLIVAVLGDQTAEFLKVTKSYGMEALVEVHTLAELELAIAAGAEMIGINNRNLETFEIDIETAFKLKAALPAHIISVAESGILEANLAGQYRQAGFDAVLIGEALVKASSPEVFLEACRHAFSLD